MKTSILSAAVLALCALGASSTASKAAGVFFDWVCDTCGADPDFSFSIEFSQAAVDAGRFVGVDGNVLSLSISSGVGDGYTNTLDDLMDDGVVNDRSNFGVIFSPDGLGMRNL